MVIWIESKIIRFLFYVNGKICERRQKKIVIIIIFKFWEKEREVNKTKKKEKYIKQLFLSVDMFIHWLNFVVVNLYL